MSTAPAGGASTAPTAPPNSAPVIRRKKPTSDPFFSGPKVRSTIVKPRANGLPGQPVNGQVQRSAPVQPPSGSHNPSRPGSIARPDIPATERVGLFSDPQVRAGGVQYTDYRLVTTKKDLLEGLRHHILQFTGDKTVDIRNESDFPKPARLHRRDPYAVAPGDVKDDVVDPKDGLNAAEREDLSRRKEIRQKEREANLAQMAPSQNAARKVPQFKKKIQQVFRADLTEEDKRRIQMNYEEKLPWHLEDFDSKHCFVGKNQQGSANMHVGFVYENAQDGSQGRFRLVPLEKLYHFKRKANFRTLNADEAEAAMNSKKQKLPQWLEDIEAKRQTEVIKQRLEQKANNKKFFSGAQDDRIAGRQGEEADFDFEEDFADDEEGAIFDDKDEDEKLAEKKIKEDLLKANIFSIKKEEEYDEEEAREKQEEEDRKKGSKAIRKALERRERNFNHASDSEEFSETDSEEERERLEQERLNNVKKEEDAEDGKKSGGASGTNTPSGRKEKIPGTASDRESGMKKSLSSRSLKRPGSPNLSDASGTDTSMRKKHKIRHPGSSQLQAGAPHSQSGSRPRQSGRAGSFAGSDTDVAMSDGEQRQRITLKITSPNGSRPGSPGPGAIPRPRSTVPDPDATPPGEDFIRLHLGREGGITSKELLKFINTHPGIKGHPEDRRKQLMARVQQMAKLDKESGTLRLKPGL